MRDERPTWGVPDARTKWLVLPLREGGLSDVTFQTTLVHEIASMPKLGYTNERFRKRLEQ